MKKVYTEGCKNPENETFNIKWTEVREAGFKSIYSLSSILKNVIGNFIYKSVALSYWHTDLKLLRNWREQWVNCTWECNPKDSLNYYLALGSSDFSQFVSYIGLGSSQRATILYLIFFLFLGRVSQFFCFTFCCYSLSFLKSFQSLVFPGLQPSSFIFL